MEIRPPANDKEFAAYYQLRYDVLRQPWGQPKGSERDILELVSVHAAAIEAGRMVGVGRLHTIGLNECKIRYMAVRKEFTGLGFGAKILMYLEIAALERGYTNISLDARESAVDFYRRQGYEIVGEGPLLWDRIPHKRMHKQLPTETAARG